MAGLNKKAGETVDRKLAGSEMAENTKNNDKNDVEISVNKQGMEDVENLDFHLY